MKNIYIVIALVISIISNAQTTENILENGNFHECNEAWELGGNFFWSYDCTGFYTQHNFSYGYMYNIQEDNAYDIISQELSFPNNITNVELDLYHKISTEEVNNNTAFDFLIIELISNSVTYLVDILSNEDYSSEYIHKTYDIPSNLFDNEIVEIAFTVNNDGLKPTRFRVDDISLFVTTNNGGGNNEPDLVVLNAAIDDNTVEVGDEINASCTIKNIGDDDCGNTRTYYVISTDQFYSSDDNLLEDENTNSLDPNETDNEDKDIIIPNLPTGVYYIIIIADAEYEEQESNEGNNVSFIPISVINPTQELGFFQVNINPAGAINDGAQWRLANSGNWQNSQDILELFPNTYEIEFKDILNWITPANQFVTVEENQTTSTSGFYEEESTISYGTITGLIYPEDAKNSGAKFKIGASGNWFNHNTTVTLEVGQHTVYFKEISNWITPSPVTVIVQENVNFDIIGNYIEENNTSFGTITGLIYPEDARNSGAKFKIGANGSWLSHNTTVTIEVGQYTVFFKNIPNYFTPNPSTIIIEENVNINILGNYEEESTSSYGIITGLIYPEEARNNGALFKIGSNGNWLNHDTEVSLEVGQYTVYFKNIPNYITPNPDTVIVQENVNLDILGNYTEENNTSFGTIKGRIFPSEVRNEGAEWKVGQNGIWRQHNDEIELATGEYSIYFKDVDGYTTPANQNITVSENQLTAVNGDYGQTVGSGWVTVNLTPNQANSSGARWRLDGGVWKNSGVTLANINYGNHTIDFKDVTGFETPNPINFELDEESEFFLGEYESIFISNFLFPSGGDSYVAGVKIRIACSFELIPSGTYFSLYYSTNGGNSWNQIDNVLGEYDNGITKVEYDWYSSNNLDSQNMKVRIITTTNNEVIEVESNNGAFEIHPSNKYGSQGFFDIGTSEMEWPFENSDWLWANGYMQGEGQHQCMEYYSQDWGKIFDPCDQIVKAPIAGKVIKIRNNLNPNCNGGTAVGTGSGNVVIIQSDIDKTFAVKILHLNDVFVNEGQNVSTNTEIGLVGSTGEASDGAHAHISLFKNIYVWNDYEINSEIIERRVIDFLREGFGYVNINSSSCNTIKNYHSAPFYFNNNSGFSENNNSTNTIVISDLNTSRYTLNVSLDNITPNISVYSSIGTKVWNENKAIMLEENNQSKKTIDLSGNQAGIYFIMIENNGNIETLKIIKN